MSRRLFILSIIAMINFFPTSSVAEVTRFFGWSVDLPDEFKTVSSSDELVILNRYVPGVGLGSVFFYRNFKPAKFFIAKVFSDEIMVKLRKVEDYVVWEIVSEKPSDNEFPVIIYENIIDGSAVALLNIREEIVVRYFGQDRM